MFEIGYYANNAVKWNTMPASPRPVSPILLHHMFSHGCPKAQKLITKANACERQFTPRICFDEIEKQKKKKAGKDVGIETRTLDNRCRMVADAKTS